MSDFGEASAESDSLPVHPERADSTVIVSVSAAGDSIILEGYARVVFSPESFAATQQVSLTRTRDARLREHLDLTGSFYSAISPFEFAFRINTGPVGPANTVKVVLMLSAEYLERLPDGYTPALFLREITGGPSEEHDYFGPYDSEFDPVSRSITLLLGPNEFYEYPDTQFGEGTKGTFEALMIVAAIP